MYLKKINLKNKIALVTGAGKGLGRACAIALAEAGADIIIISRTQKDLDKVSKIIKKLMTPINVSATSTSCVFSAETKGVNTIRFSRKAFSLRHKLPNHRAYLA